MKCCCFAFDVSITQFPCVRVKFPQAIIDQRKLITDWIAQRPDEYWVLISQSALASETHAWAAWDVLSRGKERDEMLSQSVDGEYLRLLSGTSHVSYGFSRAGVSKGDSEAWLAHLGGDENSNFPAVAKKMNLEILSTRPAPELVDERMLGIESGRGEAVCIGHIHLGQFE
jgi:tRNA threonylcarbamoyladenosine modification (KEOPS) complex Cgi121 subunit